MYPRNANKGHALVPHAVPVAGMYPPRTSWLGRSGAVMFTPLDTPYDASEEHPSGLPLITKQTS